MRYRILASFQGAPYEAGVGPTESDVVLFAACPPPEALKFEPATGHWRKRVSRDQVQTLYESRPVGMFRGERCIVLDDLSDRLHIVYLGHDAVRAAQLGYWEVDRGVFELITPRHEVTDIVEQRLPLPIRSDSGHHSRPGAVPSERPDDYGAAGGNGLPYVGGDSQLFGYGGGHDEFSTGPQPFGRSASLGGLPPSTSQDLPIAGLSRSEPTVARSADQSNVAIPPVPEPPLPLEAEALRAASSAARRGQKSSQSRQAHDTKVVRQPQPPVVPQVPAAPVPPPQPATQAQAAQAQAAQAQAAPAQAAQAQAGPALAAQAQAPAKPVEAAIAPAEATLAPPQTAEVSQPPAAPVPAAAMLTKAAMLSHAAATAARLAAAPITAQSAARSAAPNKQPDLAASPAAGSAEPSQATEQRAGVVTGAGPTPPRLTLAEPASLPAEPAPLPAEPAQPSPERVGVPAIAEATPPAGLMTDAAAQVDQPATAQVVSSEPAAASDSAATSQPTATSEPVVASEPVEASQTVVAGEPVDAQAYDAVVPSALFSPATAAETPHVAVQAPAAPQLSGQDRPTSPELSGPASDAAAEPPPVPPADAPGVSPQVSHDYADGTASAPLSGISEPPSVAYPPASAVPSWMPHGPVQPQHGFDVPPPVQPMHDVAGHDAYYAPYVTSEPMPRNGTATANGNAAPPDFGLTAPTPTPQPGFMPPAMFPPEPGPLGATDETSEPTGQAQADPGTTTRRRRSTKRRLPTQKIFSDLATQAAIPAAAYAIGEEVDGAMCLVRTDEGFEVFNAAGGSRHEVRVFQDEESAYFYLFGVLVAESVRTGALVPRN